MAEFTRVHGDFKPLINMDRAGRDNGEVNAVNSVVSGATVNVAGPKLDFFTVTLTGTGTTPVQVKAMIDTIQQLGIVYMYEFTTATNDTLAVAMYHTGGWGDVTATGAGSLDAALTAVLGEEVSIAASATFTN